MARAILVLNAGSSSLKFSIFLDGEPPTSYVRGQLEGLFTLPHFIARDAQGEVIGEQEWPSGTKLGHAGAIEFLFQWGRTTLGKQNIVAAGHRVGHGGRKFTRPVLVNAEVMHALEEFVPLAPLHQPHNLGAIQAVAKHAPALPQVACFDTAFHRAQPPVAQSFALPRKFADEGVIRYGFHGISYEYIVSVLPNFDPRAATGRTIILHLGSGASACAIQNGQSVATTMGFSPVDGLPMGTRSGSLDPGVMLYLMDRHNMDARALEKLLYQQSGLLGLSGISSDMRALSGQLRSPRCRSCRLLCLSGWPRNWIAGGSAQWARCVGVHRRHRGELSRDSCPRVRAQPPGSDWNSTRPPINPAARESAVRAVALPPGLFPRTKNS